MSEEAVLDTREVKAKLLTPTGQDHYDSFRSFVAGRLPDEIVSAGIAMCITLACADIERGEDGFTGKPLNHRLTGMHPQVLNAMTLLILREFPEPFASEAASILKD